MEHSLKKAKPQVSLTGPNCDHFVRVSLMVLDFFWIQLPKIKNNSQIYRTESQSSFTNKEVLALAMAFNLLLSNRT